MSVIPEEKEISKNLYLNNINNLIIYQKNEVLKKSIILFLSHKYNDAKEYLTDTYPEFSLNEDSNALLLMGHIFIRLHQIDSSIDFIRQSIKKLKVENYFVYDSLGIIYFLKKDYITAIKTIQDITDNNFYYYYHLGLYHEAILNDKLSNKINDESIQLMDNKQIVKNIKDYYDKALKIKDNSFKTLLNLGSIFASEEDYINAEKYYQKALSVNKNDWRIHLNLAFLY